MADRLPLPDSREMANLGLMMVGAGVTFEVLRVVGVIGMSTEFNAGIVAAGLGMLFAVCLDTIGYWVGRVAGTADKTERRDG